MSWLMAFAVELPFSGAERARAGSGSRHRLPAIYPSRQFITDGGLISYGPDTIDQFRRAANYVDRILNGEKPADLPVQATNRSPCVATVNAKSDRLLGKINTMERTRSKSACRKPSAIACAKAR
jgi:ABC-type uncharacterized transport system substrate-binding protein